MTKGKDGEGRYTRSKSVLSEESRHAVNVVYLPVQFVWLPEEKEVSAFHGTGTQQAVSSILYGK
jgi:hypothetical protein